MRPTIIKNPLNQLAQLDLAALFGVTDKSIRNWDAEGLPGTTKGRGRSYVWADVLAWYVARSSGSKAVQEVTDRARRDRADADMAQMNAAKMAGDLLDRAETVAAWSSALSRLSENLDGLGGRLAPRLAADLTTAERQDLIDREVRAALRELVDEAERQADEEVAS